MQDKGIRSEAGRGRSGSRTHLENRLEIKSLKDYQYSRPQKFSIKTPGNKRDQLFAERVVVEALINDAVRNMSK
jgi:hypothetical protein